MPVKICKVSCSDLAGMEHSVEVSAESVYEAVARALKVFQTDEWIDGLGTGLTTMTVRVRQPAPEHHLQDEGFRALAGVAWQDTG